MPDDSTPDAVPPTEALPNRLLARPAPPASRLEAPVPENRPAPAPHPTFTQALDILRQERPEATALAPPSTVQPAPPPCPSIPPPPPDDTLPARMLNEFVYCPRLFYYEHVEGVFVESADTLKGKARHKRVDSGSGALPPAQTPTAPSIEGSPAQVIHSRSVTLGSPRHRVVAKMDLVEVRPTPVTGKTGDLFAAFEVCPVEYKSGKPRPGADGNDLWPTDRIQLGLQMLLLRENGYSCNQGVIYYRDSGQRVRLDWTSNLERWLLDQIAGARTCATGPIPPPLDNSPKCPRCSLAPVCLPDETRFLAQPAADPAEAPAKPRRIIAPRDDTRALYLSTQGLYVGRKNETLQVKEEGKLLDEVRLSDLTHVALFGNIQLTTQAIQGLCNSEIPVSWFSLGGWFYGITRGHGLKNVFLRIEQFRLTHDSEVCLRLARRFIEGKIRNHRTLLMRNHVEAPPATLARLKASYQDAARAESLESLLGIEGAAAAAYFNQFSGMLKTGSDPAPSAASEAAGTESPLNFEFEGRNRRPPTDPVNALLSLAYSLLAKDCLLACQAVGFDPYVGFFHQPRFGRPALGLDLMEEFRPLIADSTVLTAINNRVVTETDFVRAGQAVNLTAAGRKKFIQTYEQRMGHLLTHPVFDYKVSYRRAIELQARILARVLTGEIPDYLPLTTR